MRKKVTLGTRGSRLAIIQTESVVERLKTAEPGLEIIIRKITTAGDRDRKTSLGKIGIAVFVKELEETLLDGRIDMAVHSLKDVPTFFPQGLSLVAVTERTDPRDVLVANASLDKLPPGAKIGTGSLRRSVQLAHYRPDLVVCPIRGNADTRLRKVATGEMDGVIVAAAALARLKVQNKNAHYLPMENFLPAVGQGALVIEARTDDKEVVELASRINNISVWQSVTAERAFLSELGGGCRAPIAALATVEGQKLRLEGMVADPKRGTVLRDCAEGEAASGQELGRLLARKLLDMGAAEFIAEVKQGGGW